MPARLVIFLFLLLTGTAKLYMWLGVTDPLKAREFDTCNKRKPL